MTEKVKCSLCDERMTLDEAFTNDDNMIVCEDCSHKVKCKKCNQYWETELLVKGICENCRNPKVCDSCGFPIEHNKGKIEDLIWMDGKYYCKDVCLPEAKKKKDDEILMKTKLYKDIEKELGHKLHPCEITDLIRKLKYEYSLKVF